MPITNGPKSFCIKSMQILKTKIEAYKKHAIFHMFLIAYIKIDFKNFLSCLTFIICMNMVMNTVSLFLTTFPCTVKKQIWYFSHIYPNYNNRSLQLVWNATFSPFLILIISLITRANSEPSFSKDKLKIRKP